MDINNNEQQVINNIRNELKAYIQKYKIQSLVIGESGGIDSALCTVLAAPVCKELNVALIGRSITIETNKPDEVSRGIAIGKEFCTDFMEIDLTSLYYRIKSVMEFDENREIDHLTKLRMGNIKVRTRMIYLYDLAQKHRGMVLSTDNYTEYLLGFWTLHGDVGDYGMIQSLWKTEVYAISQYLVNNELTTPEQKKALQDCINATPTDGLGISNSDLDQLGAPTYKDVDEILLNYLKSPEKADINNPVIKRHFGSEYKRNNPFNLSREQVFGK